MRIECEINRFYLTFDLPQPYSFFFLPNLTILVFDFLTYKSNPLFLAKISILAIKIAKIAILAFRYQDKSFKPTTCLKEMSM